jgi:glutamate-1-semialdehyde 2,1-aminomutase
MEEKNSVRLTGADREILEELADFLPDRVFDAHAHLWRVQDCRFPPGCEIAQAADGTIESWRESQERILGPGRVRGGLFLGEPRSDPAATNDYLIAQIRSAQESRAAILITPDYPRQKAVEYLNSYYARLMLGRRFLAGTQFFPSLAHTGFTRLL